MDKLQQHINKRRQELENQLKIDHAIGADVNDTWRRLKELSMVSRVLDGKKPGDPNVYKLYW